VGAVIRLVYAGRIHPSKGLHVAVRALAATRSDVVMTIAGFPEDEVYVKQVHDLIADLGIGSRVGWRGEVGRDEVRSLLGSHDVLIYPSVGPESKWLGVLEGLAAGCVVVSSTPGAPRELLRHGENALLFPPGDDDALAGLLDAFGQDPSLAASLAQGALATAERHTVGEMVDRIDQLVTL